MNIYNKIYKNNFDIDSTRQPLIPRYFGAYRDGNVAMIVLERLHMDLDEYFTSLRMDFTDVAIKLVYISIYYLNIREKQ